VILTLVRKQDAMRYDSNYIRQLMREVQHYSEQDAQLRTAILEKFQRDDYGLLASPAALNAWSARQTYLPLANMMTVAALMGIDSCPIEGFDKPNLAALLSNEFSIPFAEWEPAYLLTLGCRKADPVRAKTRQESHLVVDWFI
jgi:nitroreductase